MNETIKTTLQNLVKEIKKAKKEKKYINNLYILQSFSFTFEQQSQLKELKKQIKTNQNKINLVIKGL